MGGWIGGWVAGGWVGGWMDYAAFSPTPHLHRVGFVAQYHPGGQPGLPDTHALEGDVAEGHASLGGAMPLNGVLQ